LGGEGPLDDIRLDEITETLTEFMFDLMELRDELEEMSELLCTKIADTEKMMRSWEEEE